jgi:hypothetical protein
MTAELIQIIIQAGSLGVLILVIVGAYRVMQNLSPFLDKFVTQLITTLTTMSTAHYDDLKEQAFFARTAADEMRLTHQVERDAFRAIAERHLTTQDKNNEVMESINEALQFLVRETESRAGQAVKAETAHKAIMESLRRIEKRDGT